MATLTISLPDSAIEWIEYEVRRGSYASTDDYFRSLIIRDQAAADDAPSEIMEFPSPDDRQFTLEELRRRIEESRASGISSRTMADIVEEGDRRIASVRVLRG